MSMTTRLPPEVQQSLSSMLCRHCVKMSPQALGNSIFALGKMGAIMSAFPDRVTVALEVAMRRAAPKMVRRDAMQTLQGISNCILSALNYALTRTWSKSVQ